MKKINVRAFASIALFFLLIILFVTAVGIEYIDHVLDGRQNGETSPLLHKFLRIHSLAGYLFCASSIIHIINNWKVLKKYIK